MGFECGFEVIPRLKDITAEQYFYAKAQKYYELTIVPHCDGFYKSFEDWFVQSYSWFGSEVECKYPDQMDYVMEYADLKPETIDFWCSIGRRLDDDYVHGYLKQIKPFEYYPVTKEWVEQTLERINESLEQEQLIPATIIYAMHYNDDNEKVLTNCDGVLVEDEDGHQQLIELEYDNIWVAPRCFDTDYHYAKESFKKTLEKLLTYDFEKNIIFYFRSY